MIPEPLITELRRLSTAEKIHVIKLLASELSEAASQAEHDPSQAWFWTAEWQAKEREADDDIREGRYDDYDTVDDFINGLEVLEKPRI